MTIINSITKISNSNSNSLNNESIGESTNINSKLPESPENSPRQSNNKTTVNFGVLVLVGSNACGREQNNNNCSLI